MFIVRWPSGVTSTRQRPLAGPSFANCVEKSTLAARISWAKAVPASSAFNLPMKAALQPRLAVPMTVLAAEPSGYDGYRTHGLIERLGARLVDQHHAALVQALGGEKIIIGPADNVDNGVTKTKHIEPVR